MGYSDLGYFRVVSYGLDHAETNPAKIITITFQNGHHFQEKKEKKCNRIINAAIDAEIHFELLTRRKQKVPCS